MFAIIHILYSKYEVNSYNIGDRFTTALNVVKDLVCYDGGECDQRRNLSMFARVVSSIRYGYRMK